MSELELALTNLGREVDYPEPPDLTGAVRRRLAEGRRPFAWRRPLVVVLAALVVAVAAAMVVPQARSQILDWLGIGSVTVRYVDELPETEKTSDDLRLGTRVSLDEAREQSAFPIRVPTLEGLERPEVYRGDLGQVSFLYGSEDEPRLLITQIIGTGVLEKLLQEPETTVELVRVGRAEGAWLEGGEHVLYFPNVGPESQRLVGNTLLLQRPDGATVRIEADISKAEALRIFRSMR